MGRFNSFEINFGKKSRIFNKRIYEITNGEDFKKDLVRQIRRHQFQFHQILQKDLLKYG
jgi:predicted HicB family RNase H-like nuclease